MLEELLHIDREAFLFLNNLGSQAWDGFWLFTTGKWSSLPLYLLLLILSARLLGWKRTLLLLATVALLIAVCDQLSNFFKVGVGRLRPCYDPDLDGLFRLVKASCGGKYGYFSAHAANTFAVAVFFSHLLRTGFRWMPWLLVFWAGLVSYSRIYIGVHFPLDVVSGALVGTFMGWLFFRLYIFALDRTRL
ncbi:undecaprenyl-diphosphatase [Muriicola jejuensis]|uniref:Phosphatase PAP2 family protein n=1 Tax=Muriicola jejuensis TaxID=504488 RepID=A0A6P0UKL3_9FLAO|nr:phosphatase PAP2 family protein [Muriicola jejuensis]NER10766.1 phosphatase PAP2 family protein [Muriicola jejuensis]SMP16346.1 undecaprenyl-diphosphatase [Muriicola jejuensis]